MTVLQTNEDIIYVIFHQEMDTVLRSQAVISASQSNKASNSNTADTKEDTNESKTEEKSTSRE